MVVANRLCALLPFHWLPRLRFTAVCALHYLSLVNLGAWCVMCVGMKKFPECVDFALEYIDFLWNQNDSEYLKVTFERILKTLPAQVRPRTSDMVWRFLSASFFRSGCGIGSCCLRCLDLPRYEDLLRYILLGVKY